jgi:hypothetical protein
MKRLSRLLGVLLFVVPLGAAEDFTGKWTGSFASTRPDGTPNNDKIFMDVKHTGKDIAGTAGPTETQQWPLKGTVDGNKVAFDVQADGGQLLIKFALVFADGHLKGEATAEANGEKLQAKIDMTRTKEKF